MQLSLEHRRVGDATVVTCSGRLIAGVEADALQKSLEDLIPRTRHVVLHLGGIDYIDSGGLGLLVRYLSRTQRSSGSLSVCAVSPKIDEVLRVTKLKSVFPPYETEAAAISEAHKSDAAAGSAGATVLCADGSTDVSVYLRELLKAAGYRVLTANNLPDALILFIATKPKVVVLSSELYAMRGTRAADEFHRLATQGAVVELPKGFSGHEATEAAGEVLRAVAAAC